MVKVGFISDESIHGERKNCLNLENGVTILNVEQLLHEAMEAFNNNEMNEGEVSCAIFFLDEIFFSLVD